LDSRLFQPHPTAAFCRSSSAEGSQQVVMGTNCKLVPTSPPALSAAAAAACTHPRDGRPAAPRPESGSVLSICGGRRASTRVHADMQTRTDGVPIAPARCLDYLLSSNPATTDGVLPRAVLPRHHCRD